MGNRIEISQLCGVPEDYVIFIYQVPLVEVAKMEQMKTLIGRSGRQASLTSGAIEFPNRRRLNQLQFVCFALLLSNNRLLLQTIE